MIHNPSALAATMKLSLNCPKGRSSPSKFSGLATSGMSSEGCGAKDVVAGPGAASCDGAGGGNGCALNGKRPGSTACGCGRNEKPTPALYSTGRGSAGIGIVTLGGAVTGNVDTGRVSESFWRKASRKKSCTSEDRRKRT